MAICRICRRERRKNLPLMPLREEKNLFVCYDCYPVYRRVNNSLAEFVEGFIKLKIGLKTGRKKKNILLKDTQEVRELRFNFLSQILATIQYFNGDTPDHRANNFACISCMKLLSMTEDKLSQGLNNGNQRLKKIKYWTIELAKIIKNNNHSL